MEPTYTIKVEPSRSPGKVTATSSDGDIFTASMCEACQKMCAAVLTTSIF
jgi:hypothetical protein